MVPNHSERRCLILTESFGEDFVVRILGSLKMDCFRFYLFVLCAFLLAWGVGLCFCFQSALVHGQLVADKKAPPGPKRGLRVLPSQMERQLALMDSVAI